MPRMDRIGKYKTKITTDGNETKVKLFESVIVTLRGNGVILRDGGWRTNTTKNRINQTMRFYGYPIKVFQRRFRWYVDVKGEVFEWDGDDAMFVINL